MTVEQITTIITNLLTGGGIAVFLFYLIRGLKQEIKNLNQTVETQKKTLEVMKEQTNTFEDITELHKKLTNEFPALVDQTIETLHKTKDRVIAELERANEQQDKQLQEAKKKEIEQLEKEERLLKDYSELQKKHEVTEKQLRLKSENLIESKQIKFLLSWNRHKLSQQNENFTRRLKYEISNRDLKNSLIPSRYIDNALQLWLLGEVDREKTPDSDNVEASKTDEPPQS